jgi:hypothetical protein
VAELKKLDFLRGLEAAGWDPLDNDPQPAQRTIHPKQLDSQAPTRAIEHDTFHTMRIP